MDRYNAFCIQVFNSSFHFCRWFFEKTDKHLAERMLLQEPNQCGSFLVRESETVPGDFSLSIRYKSAVRHYRIKHDSEFECGSFFISTRRTFNSIVALVAYYKRPMNGLCIGLKNPCFPTEKPLLGTQVVRRKAMDHKQIDLAKKLGANQLSEVWEGIWNGTAKVAVKVIKPEVSVCFDPDFMQNMEKICHQNIVQLYGIVKEEPVYIITELMKHGSLLEYLHGDGRSKKLPNLIDMAAQVAAGMAYLEELGCVHRNLAARNVLVGNNDVCKVADFGLSEIINDYIVYPNKWTAPEVTEYDRFTKHSDAWSFGIVLYEIITYGRFPYPGMTTAEALEQISQGYRMPRPSGCPHQLYEIMLDCWREEPYTRPSFETLQWQLEEFFVAEDGGYKEPDLGM